MKKKYNGFTLMELLATIAIISIVTLIATVTYSKVRKDILNRQYNNLKTLIETSGVKYTAKYGYTSFFVQELIDDGLLEPDDDDNVYDPRNDEKLNCHLVQTSVDDNGNYTAKLGTEDYSYGKGCDPSKVDSYGGALGLTAVITNTNISYTSTTNNGQQIGPNGHKAGEEIYKDVNIVNGWTNKDLDFTATLTQKQKENRDDQSQFDYAGAKYVWNKNTDTTTIHPVNKHTSSMFEYYNDNYYVDMYTRSNEHFEAKLKVLYDKEKPVIYGDKTKYANPADENKWAKTKTLLIYVSDKNGVGIDRIYAGSRPCSDMLKLVVVTKTQQEPELRKLGQPAIAGMVQKYEVDDVEAGENGENGLINICAVDKLGNLADTSTFVIKKVDITPPQCANVVGDHNEYQSLDRTIDQYCYDNNVINGKNVVGSQCTQEYFEKTFSPSNGSAIKVGTIVIKDNVKWETECPVNVYIDRKGPTCGSKSGEGSTSSWAKSERQITVNCSDENAGCKQSSFTGVWGKNVTTAAPNNHHVSEEDVIKTSTVEIRDKTPKCSQTSTTSNNCANYETIKNTAENLDNYNNTTNCSVNAYIDYKKPEPKLKQSSGYTGSSAKVYCTDDDSGPKSLSATYSGTTKTASGSGTVSFKFNSAGSYNISATCVDNADDGGNSKTKTLNYTVTNPPSDGDASGKVVTVNGRPCELSGSRTYRADNCEDWGYDAYVQDAVCPSDMSGKGVTCCFDKETPGWGPKTLKSTATPLNGNVGVPTTDVDGYPYAIYNGKRYYPTYDDRSTFYDGANGVTYYTKGYEVLHYKCYMDHMSGSTGTMLDKICCNYTD